MKDHTKKVVIGAGVFAILGTLGMNGYLIKQMTDMKTANSNFENSVKNDFATMNQMVVTRYSDLDTQLAATNERTSQAFQQVGQQIQLQQKQYQAVAQQTANSNMTQQQLIEQAQAHANAINSIGAQYQQAVSQLNKQVALVGNNQEGINGALREFNARISSLQQQDNILNARQQGIIQAVDQVGQGLNQTQQQQNTLIKYTLQNGFPRVQELNK
jgi:chromosome segregation ATPase